MNAQGPETKRPHEVGAAGKIRAIMLLFAAVAVGFGTGALQAAPSDDDCSHSECNIGEWCKMKAGYECTFEDPWTCSDSKCNVT